MSVSGAVLRQALGSGWTWSFLAAAGALVWIWTAPPRPPIAPPAPPAPPLVLVREQSAESLARDVALAAVVEPWRRTEARAALDGRISETPVEEGTMLAARDVIARLLPEDRPARLREAEAKVAARRAEAEAARALLPSGGAARNRAIDAEARLAEAEREQAAAARAVEDLEVRTPFPARLERRLVEPGRWVMRGDLVAELADVSRLRARGFAAERDLPLLREGASARFEPREGVPVEGRVVFVAARAEAPARTWRVEVEIPPGLAPGQVGRLVVSGPERMLHRIPLSALTSDATGRIGVKGVEEGRMRFHPVRLIGGAGGDALVEGPPERFRLVVRGQDLARDGAPVRTEEMR
jgi:multidrug efflux system membrane fusion protein